MPISYFTYRRFPINWLNNILTTRNIYLWRLWYNAYLPTTTNHALKTLHWTENNVIDHIRYNNWYLYIYITRFLYGISNDVPPMESNYNCNIYNLMSPPNWSNVINFTLGNPLGTQRFCDIKSKSLTLIQRRVPNWNWEIDTRTF